MSTVGYLLGAGSRNAPNWLRGTVRAKLHGMLTAAVAASDGRLTEFEIFVGDAPGVDAEIVAWLRSRVGGIPIRLHEGAPFVATWSAECDERCSPGHRKWRSDGTDFCPAQGPYRNGRMVALAKQYHDAGAWVRGAAFYADPKSNGTADCVRQARAAGLIVTEFGNVPGRKEGNEGEAVPGLRT